MKGTALYLSIAGVALVIGASAGFIYKRAFTEPTENIIGFNPDKVKPNIEALFDSVEKAGSAKAATEKLQPYEIAVYAFEKYKQNEYCVSFCTGLADTAVKQYIRSAQIKRGDNYFEEQISKSSMVGVAKRLFQEGEHAETKIYNETSSGDVVVDENNAYAKYKSDPDVLSYDDFKTNWGKNLPDMSTYLIGSSTVEKQELVKDGSGYKIMLSLQPTKGAYNYRSQMKTISDLAAYPTFSLLDLTYWVDENLTLVKMNEHSKFTATMVGISAGVENDINYHYFPGKEMKFPTLDENFDYQSLIKEASKWIKIELKK